MKKSRILRIATVAFLALASQPLYADMGNGTYTIPLGSTLPLWDISGNYDFSGLVPWSELLGEGTVSAGHGYSLNIDPSGKFNGADSINYDDKMGNSVSGNVSVDGAVKNSRVKMKVLLSGSAILGAGLVANVDFGASAVVNFTVDGSGHRLIVKSGSARLTAKDYNSGKKRSRTFRIPSGTVVTLPVKVTGDWNLNLQLSPNGKTYAATGTVETSTGATLSLTGTGIYQDKTDTSKILLKGPSSTLNLVLSTSGTNAWVKSVVGKLYGQNVKF